MDSRRGAVQSGVHEFATGDDIPHVPNEHFQLEAGFLLSKQMKKRKV
jgi:hypothetical protein